MRVLAARGVRMVALAATLSACLAQDLVVSDRMSGSYFCPNRTFWLTGCTYFATPFTPTVTGPVKWMILSLSEGPTYSRVRGLGVGIYATSNGKPAATPLYYGHFQSIRDQNYPIQMNTGTSNWELPVFAYDISGMVGAPVTLTAGTQYWLAMQQTRSTVNQLTGAANPSASALPTPTAEPYFQTRLNRVDVYTNNVGTPLNDRGCPVRYPYNSEFEGWKGPANVGTVNPFRPINTRGVAVAFCGAQSIASCGEANFPASPSTTRSPSATRSTSITPSVSHSTAATVSPTSSGAAIIASDTPSAGYTPSSSPTASTSESTTPTASSTSSSTSSASSSETSSSSSSSTASSSATPSTSGSATASESVSASISASQSLTQSGSVTASVTSSASVSHSRALRWQPSLAPSRTRSALQRRLSPRRCCLAMSTMLHPPSHKLRLVAVAWSSSMCSW